MKLCQMEEDLIRICLGTYASVAQKLQQILFLKTAEISRRKGPFVSSGSAAVVDVDATEVVTDVWPQQLSRSCCGCRMLLWQDARPQQLTR